MIGAKWVPQRVCFKTVFTKDVHLSSFSDMHVMSKACIVWHLCPVRSTISMTSFSVSSFKVSLSSGTEVFNMSSTVFTSQVSFCWGKDRLSSKAPFINCCTSSVLPKLTPSYLHKQQLSADLAVHTALSDALSLTSLARGGGESGSACLSLAYSVHFLMYMSYIWRVCGCHDDVMISAASSEIPYALSRHLTLCRPVVPAFSSGGVSLSCHWVASATHPDGKGALVLRSAYR